MQNKTYAVLTDSACDMPQQMAEQCGVDIMNFDISMDGKSYTERVDFTFDEYYDMLRTCQGVPSTSHITQLRFLQQFLHYDDMGLKEVMYVSINSTGSATHDAAVMGRRQFHEERPNSHMKVYIVDSHCYSMVYGWYVAQAIDRLEKGETMYDVATWLNDIFTRVEIVLGAFSLKFMKKSGRISAAAAIAGELLGVRPVITLNDGVSCVIKKVRGDKDLLPALLQHAGAHHVGVLPYFVAGTDSQVMKQLAKMCTNEWGEEPTTMFKLGAAVATNTGPEAIALVFMGPQRRQPDAVNVL